MKDLDLILCMKNLYFDNIWDVHVHKFTLQLQAFIVDTNKKIHNMKNSIILSVYIYCFFLRLIKLYVG